MIISQLFANVLDLHICLDIFNPALLWAAMALERHDLLLPVVFLHPADMAKPSQPPMSQDHIQGGKCQDGLSEQPLVSCP